MPKMHLRELESESASLQFVKELHLALTLQDVREVFFGTAQRLLGSDAIGFYRFQRSRGSHVVEKKTSLGEAFVDNYEQIGRQDDPVLQFVVETQMPGNSAQLAPSRWDSSGAYNALREVGLLHSLEAPLIIAGEMVGTLNFARATDSSQFNDDNLTMARFVSEHLSLAMERVHRHDALGERAAALQGAIEHFPQGVLVHDLEGTPIYANRQATELIGGLGKVPNISHLAGLITNAVADFIADKRHAATLNLRDAITGQRIILKLHLAVRQHAVVAHLFECPDEETAALPVWGVLTAREQEIATLVSQGSSTRQIAAKSFISENTVKQHLKRIFAKTDVHSRAELVQLIWAAKSVGEPPGGTRT